MKNATIWGVIALLTILFSATAFAAELSDTKIDYFDYREVVPGEAGVVYKIKLTNTGDAARSYELTPNTDAVKSVGTYRIDPSSRVTLKAGESRTLYFYLALERGVHGRLSIPVEVSSGNEKTTIELAARSVGEFTQAAGSGWLSQVLKVAFFTLIVLIFLVLIITLFKKGRKKNTEKNEEEEPSEVQTYY